jgi:hypothetical protein
VVNREAIHNVQWAGALLEDAVERLYARVTCDRDSNLVRRTLQTDTRLHFAFRLAVNMFMIRGVEGLEMEWAYAFDLHINGFFVFFSWIYVLQPFLLPILTAQKWISLLMGNTLYFVA